MYASSSVFSFIRGVSHFYAACCTLCCFSQALVNFFELWSASAQWQQWWGTPLRWITGGAPSSWSCGIIDQCLGTASQMTPRQPFAETDTQLIWCVLLILPPDGSLVNDPVTNFTRRRRQSMSSLCGFQRLNDFPFSQFLKFRYDRSGYWGSQNKLWRGLMWLANYSFHRATSKQ